MKMRHIFLMLMAAGLLAGCGNSGIKQTEASITGTLTPPVPGFVTITAGPVLDSARIGRDGSFEITVPIGEPLTAVLFFGNRFSNIYLEPGKAVTLDINSLIFPDKTAFGGELGPVNRYLTLARKLDQQSDIPANALFSLEPEQFIAKSDSIKQLKMKLLDEFDIKYKEIESAFIDQIRADIELTWALQHLQYPGNYQLLKGTIAPLAEGYHFDYLNQLNLNSPANIASPAYQNFVQAYLDYRQSGFLQEHPNIAALIFPESIARFRLVYQEFANPEVVDYLLFTAMHDHLANFGTTHVESFLTDFRLKCKNPEYLSTIESLVTNMEKVGAGMPAPDFTAFRQDGSKVRLSDFFGQLLYIGFWASWSEWSMQEIPYFEQLRKDFQGQPVQFMMISLDFEKDKKLWSAIIQKNNFGSIQLIQDPKSTILQDNYFLNDFPRYFLIDREGKIISVYAPRPTENIAETLTRAIKAGN